MPSHYHKLLGFPTGLQVCIYIVYIVYGLGRKKLEKMQSKGRSLNKMGNLKGGVQRDPPHFNVDKQTTVLLH